MYRDYDNLDEAASRVKETYRAMHTNQTYEFALAKVLQSNPPIPPSVKLPPPNIYRCSFSSISSPKLALSGYL